jgi:hypothetical protein
LAGYALPKRTNARSREPGESKSSISARSGFAFTTANRFSRSLRLCFHPSGGMLATLGYNGVVGYLITAADGGASVNLTDSEWRALIYVASQHDFSAPHLRLERDDESVDMGGSDAEELRSALGKALEARDVEAIMTPDGELAYEAIQRVRHVLLAGEVRLARTRA